MSCNYSKSARSHYIGVHWQIAAPLVAMTLLVAFSGLLFTTTDADARDRSHRVPVVRDPAAQNPDDLRPGNGPISPSEVRDYLANVGETLPQNSFPTSGTPEYDEIGGDDRLIMEDTGISRGSSMDIADNGDIYVAVEIEERVPNIDYGIQVYRSQDGGQTWTLWGEKSDASSTSWFREPSLRVAEGTFDRVFLAYEYHVAGFDNVINVSYSELNLPAASFTVRGSMVQTGVSFTKPYLASDEDVFNGYYLYLVAEGDDGSGGDIWFDRCIDRGDTWQGEYKIAPLNTVNRKYQHPIIAYGRDGALHCVWDLHDDAGTLDDAVRYRRAQNWADAGVADWETINYLTSSTNGFKERLPVIAASHSSDRVVVAYSVNTLGGVVEGSEIWPSYDAGTTWDPLDIDAFEGDFGAKQLLAIPNGTGFVFAAVNESFWDYGIRAAAETTPLVWSGHKSFLDRAYDNSMSFPPGRFVAVDPSRDHRIAMAWVDGVLYEPLDTLLFDAEWLTDPGIPNIEPGFPVALPYGAVSPPGICELDGDVQSEIVYADTRGYVNAINHDGTPLPGWPQLLDVVPHDSPVAVGDLNGDGYNEVVCGNDVGEVFVFNRDGTHFPGWPKKLVPHDSVYVSIGALTEHSNRQIVACVGDTLYLLEADGTINPPFPIKTAGPIRASAAIGDVDNNGTREIVMLQEQYMNVITATGGSQAHRSFTSAGKTFKNSPTLGDLDMDGDLEIVAPTEQGDVYVMNHDGTDFPGWPFSYPNGGPITSVALTNIRAGGEPELAFASKLFAVHAHYFDGGILGGYPEYTSPTTLQLGMPILERLEGSGDVLHTCWDDSAHAWDNFGWDLYGWPLALPGDCIVSPATGDIDHDGMVEAVFLTYTNPSMVVIDLNSPIRRAEVIPNRWWPMYAYNPQRTGCLGCEPDVVVPVAQDPTVAAWVRFAAPVPNPAMDAVSLAFELPGEAAVRLTVFDVAGRRVRRLVKTEMAPGTYRYVWDGLNDSGARVTAGNYYVRLSTAGPAGVTELVRKVTMIR